MFYRDTQRQQLCPMALSDCSKKKLQKTARKNDSASDLSSCSRISEWFTQSGRFTRSNVRNQKKKKIERTDVWKATAKSWKYFPRPAFEAIHARNGEGFVLTYPTRSRRTIFFFFFFLCVFRKRAKNHEFSTECGREFARAIEESRCARNTELTRKEHEWHEFFNVSNATERAKNRGTFRRARINPNCVTIESSHQIHS